MMDKNRPPNISGSARIIDKNVLADRCGRLSCQSIGGLVGSNSENGYAEIDSNGYGLRSTANVTIHAEIGLYGSRKYEMNVTKRSELRRIPARGSRDWETICQILDEGFLAHVGFSVHDQPFVIPTLYGRRGENLYLHGSAASRMLKELETGIPACVTVTLVDGLVLARSAFHHSMNYRRSLHSEQQGSLRMATKKLSRCESFPSTSSPVDGLKFDLRTKRN
jgi:hypothetical protein